MYNVSQYLEKCIKNINIENIDYEILMINDGSPDNSLELAGQLKAVKPNIKILSQENKGLGGARNLGIKNAIGKYILFLDADDILIKQDYKSLEEEHADIIEFSSRNVNESQNIISEFNANNVKECIDGILYAKNNPSMFSACNKLYSNRFLKANNLFFKEHIYIEDFEFNTRAFILTKSLKSYNSIIQHFVQMPNSITRNNDKIRKLKLVNDMIIVAHSINTFKENNNISNSTFIEERLTWLTVDIIYHSLKNNLGNIFLNEKINELKKNDLYRTNVKLKNINKERFRKLLNFPLGLSIIVFFLNLKYGD